MVSNLRRIVTGQLPGGKSFFTSDGAPPFAFALPNEINVVDIWRSQAAPAELRADGEEPTESILNHYPPAGGSCFRIAELPPASKVTRTAESTKALFDQMGSSAALVSHTDPRGSMHRTETLDYGIILNGGITLIVDEGEVELKAGDVVIQRGTNHIWYNHTEEPCRIAFIMIDATYPGSSKE